MARQSTVYSVLSPISACKTTANSMSLSSDGAFTVPNVTAKSWAICDATNQTILWGKNETDRREIASLTKIMTAYTAIKIMTRLDVNMMSSKIEVSSEATTLGGTTAGLSDGDSLTVWDMLHALLLPSGNDAAFCIAEYFGLLLCELGLPPLAKSTNLVDIFVAEMNANAKNLKLSGTTYANPHGLANPYNKSTAADIAKLSSICMGMPLFAEIVRKTKYSCLARTEEGKQKVYTWNNTNRLLTKGFNGVKTGITPTAGPCLASSFKDSKNHLVIVILNCKTPDHRWHEMNKLKDFAIGLLGPPVPVKVKININSPIVKRTFASVRASPSKRLQMSSKIQNLLSDSPQHKNLRIMPKENIINV